jgi:2-C-methyl-D-erythritol 4-phosphate cytidylyltransferase
MTTTARSGGGGERARAVRERAARQHGGYPDSVPAAARPSDLVDFVAVLVMAGAGERLRAEVPKAFVEVGGRPMWRHAAATLASLPGCRQIVLVVPLDRVARTVADAQDLGVPVRVVPGGARRQDSVRLGIGAATARASVVAVHDAARPLLSRETAAEVIREAARTGAALAASPVRDTLKRVRSDGTVEATVDRKGLWQAQTPQAFRWEVARAAHAEAERRGIEATDDAALVEALGLSPVRVVRGDPWNFKVTEPPDLAAAEALLAPRRRSPGAAKGRRARAPRGEPLFRAVGTEDTP